MADTGYKSMKPLWWALTIVAFVALVAITIGATRHSNRAVQQASATGSGVGTAYDPTTGRTVPAGATPGAIGTNGPPPLVDPRANSQNGSAGGTTAGVNPQANPAPGPVASGADTPPANLNR